MVIKSTSYTRNFFVALATHNVDYESNDSAQWLNTRIQEISYSEEILVQRKLLFKVEKHGKLMHFSAFPPFAPIRGQSITQQAHHMPRQVRQTTRTISSPLGGGEGRGGQDLQLKTKSQAVCHGVEGQAYMPYWLYQSSYHRLLKADTMSPCTIHSVLQFFFGE